MFVQSAWKWCLWLIPAALFGEEIAAPITSVTVYDRAALVKRSVEVSLSKGKNSFHIAGFPSSMDDSTISAKFVSPDARLNGASIEYKFEAIGTDAEEEAAKAALQTAHEAVNVSQNEIQRLNAELSLHRTLLPAMPAKKPDGTPRKFDSAAWENILKYTSDAMSGNFRKLRAAQLKDLELKKVLTIAQEKYDKLFSRAKTMRKTVKVTAESGKDMKTVLEITYLIPNASWSPAYDIRVDTNSNEVKISTYAILRQTTGEDWLDVPILFSTAIPSVSADLPEFRKILITEKFNDAQGLNNPFASAALSEPRRENFEAPRKAKKIMNAPSDCLLKEEVFEEDRGNARKPDTFLREQKPFRQAVIRQSGEWLNTIQFKDGRNMKIRAALNTDSQGGVSFRSESGEMQRLDLSQIKEISAVSRETQGLDFEPKRLRIPSQYLAGLDYKFSATRPDTVFSDGQYRKIALKTETFQGEKYYYFIPYLSEYAFRKCRVKNNGFVPLLAGPASIFHGTEYVGDTDISTVSSRGGFFTVNIGVDQRVKLERKTERMSENTGVISSYRKTSIRSTVTVKNQTPESIKYEFVERVPVSSMKEIQVGAVKLNDREIKNWIYTGGCVTDSGIIPSGKDKLFQLAYFIEYPADYVVMHSDGGGMQRPGFGPAIDASSAVK